MSNSVVKVTDSTLNDSLFLLVGEDGTVTPDRQTVETFLSSRDGPTNLQVMHINRADGKNIEMSVDNLTYIHSEDIDEEAYEEMDEMARNLLSFRLDHDYTPLTSPRQQSPVQDIETIDDLAETLSILEGTSLQANVLNNTSKTVKVVKSTPKTTNKKHVPTLSAVTTSRSKVKVLDFKHPKALTQKPSRQKTKQSDIDTQEFDVDEDYEEEETGDDDGDNDSDFEIDDVPSKQKTPKRTRRTRSKSQSEQKQQTAKVQKVQKQSANKSPASKVQEPDTKPVEKPPDTALPATPESKQQDKKAQKKEKKTPKQIPEDFALFSTPDIIRRVGGKDVTMPSTPGTPESPTGKPQKISPESRSKSNSERASGTKPTRLSTDVKISAEETKSTSPEKSMLDKQKSNDNRIRRSSVDKTKVVQKSPLEKFVGKKNVDVSVNNKINADMVQIQNLNDNENTNSSELPSDTTEHMPTAEDIRSIILNENTKSFTTSLVLPDTNDISSEQQQTMDPGNMNLDAGTLDLDQSILDNINSDLISEDILYQVAKQLVDNTDLQNVIDKSIVDGNLVLDPSLQNAMIESGHLLQQPATSLPDEMSMAESYDNLSPTHKGTQIVRPDGRIVVIPPIERPTTRSRNKKSDTEAPKSLQKPASKPLDDEHVSGNELDSSESEEDKSEDDPDKLWCICNQPHNNRFMICCDTCEEWYHGKCVNVTKAMGQLMEQEGREWICVYCKDSSLTRPKAAARRIRKASRASTDSSGSSKKPGSSSASEIHTPVSSKSSNSASALACIVCGKPSRKNSIYCSEACILKHAQGVERVVVFDRASGKILSGNKAPSAANLEKWLQEHPSYEVVRSTSKNTQSNKPLTQSKLKLIKNPANDGVSLAVHKKGVSIGVLQYSPKQQQQLKSPMKTHITGLKIVSKKVALSQQNQAKTKNIQLLKVSKTTPPTTPPIKVKTVQTTLKSTAGSKEKEKLILHKTPKSRQAEQAAQPKQENIREVVYKTLSEQLLVRLKEATDLSLSEEQVNNISTEIESQLYKCFGDTGQKYKNKYRSLIFNIKDVKNQTLWRRICEKSINPYQLVRLSPDDLASQELALWRERETKHQLDMIKKSELELLNCNRQYVFKTHKGEQVLEDGRPKDGIDSTEVIANLGADSTSLDSSDSKQDSKEKDKRGSSKHSRRDKDRGRKSSKDKSDSKDHKKESSSKDHDRRKRSRSKEHSTKHSDRKRSRSRDRDRHHRSSHKTSRHKKEGIVPTDKLDKRSKEILEQLVDKQIVPPLEDRLWKHVQQEDFIAAPNIESDSDHEPSSTVIIPTPPRTSDLDESHTTPASDLLEKSEELTDSAITNDAEASQSPVRLATDFLWKGSISMVDVAQISITAHEVSGDCNGLGEELPPTLEIVGRISPDTVWDYIGKMKCSNSKVISLIRLNATNVEEKMPYIALYSYLSSRNRLGVVKSVNKAVKDFYVLPLAVQKPIPQALLPISGPGFEESRPPLLLGIIVRDKRKRPLLSEPTLPTKRVRVEIETPPELPQTPPPVAPARSYTPPPSRDPRVKVPLAIARTPSPVTVTECMEITAATDDMDEPYSPEDSDPDSSLAPMESGAVSASTHLNADDLSNLLTGSVKSSSFLESGLNTQTFEPFANKFDTIPGLDDATGLPSNSQELQKKMAELDQRIAMQKAEIDNMSQDIVSTATGSSDIGTTALANIALPSNLQQILDSIKTIGVAASTDSQDSQGSSSDNTSLPGASSTTDLTIPLMLPKISTRTQKTDIPTNTIPLNIPNKPKRRIITTPPPNETTEKGSSVLSSLSEEDLIRKAAEMLGETSNTSAKKVIEVAPFTPNVPPPFIFNTPPPNIVSLPVAPPVPTASPSVQKRPKLDLPPVPGLEDRT